MFISLYSLAYGTTEVTAAVLNKGTISERKKNILHLLDFLAFFSGHSSLERSGTASADV